MAQEEGETVDKFIAKLRKQAQNCNFANPDIDIRDQVTDKCDCQHLEENYCSEKTLN